MTRASFKLLFLLGILLASLVVHAATPLILVTDIDDTIKMTDVPDLGFTVMHGLCGVPSYGGLCGAPAFAGMSALYKAMSPSSQDLIALSGGPAFTHSQVNEFLKKYQFAPSKVLLKPSLWDSTEEFKVSQLNKIAASRPGDFILVGDDTERDPESFARFYASYPDRVKAMYIHVVVDRPVPSNEIRFHTALDMALDEYLYHRLPLSAFVTVGRAMLAAPESTFLPEYVACPHSFLPSSVLADPTARGVLEAVDARVQSLCTQRYANPNWRRYYNR